MAPRRAIVIRVKPGTRVRMRDVGNNWITGTVRGPGATKEVRPLNPVEDENIATVVVEWDDPALGSNAVSPQGLEELPS